MSLPRLIGCGLFPSVESTNGPLDLSRAIPTKAGGAPESSKIEAWQAECE
jgi:hypothetical protein